MTSNSVVDHSSNPITAEETESRLQSTSEIPSSAIIQNDCTEMSTNEMDDNCASIESFSNNNHPLKEFQIEFQPINAADIVEQECPKCRRRNNSPSLPLKFVAISCRKIIHRMFFGAMLKVIDGMINSCLECANFITHSKGACWKYSWPATLNTMMTNDSFLSGKNNGIFKIWIPQSYRVWWQQVVSFTRRSHEPVFCDITCDIEKFQQRFNDKKSNDYASLLNDSPYCEVKCVHGDTTFISENGGIAFHHFLQLWFPEFTQFGADYEQHLAGIRSDYFKSYTRLDDYEIKPCLKSDPKKAQKIGKQIDGRRSQSNRRAAKIRVEKIP